MRKLIIAASLAFSLLGTNAVANPQIDCVDFYNDSDYQRALEPCTIMAEQGFTIFQYILGQMYRQGWGVAQNYTEAVRWYRAAAEQGDAVAQHNLGFMYREGLGVPQNFVKAHMWFNVSASNGGERASENRNLLAKHMTPQQIAEAQALAVQCMNSNYKGC